MKDEIVSAAVRTVSSPWFLCTVGPLVAFKVWMKLTAGWCKSDARLDGKTVVVTGANSGVGFEAAKDFARRGARVVMVCRDMKKAEAAKEEIITETKNGNITLKHVDFTSLTKVRKCANEILSEERRIDVLLNNAGMVDGGFKKTEDGLDVMMQSNYFGPFLFTNILLGRIKESSPSRIVNVSSEMHRMAKLDLNRLDLSHTKNDSAAYSTTKLCLLLMMTELSSKLDGTGVTVNSVTPGVVSTAIVRHSGRLYKTLWRMSSCLLKNPVEGAQTLIYACVLPDLTNVSGVYFMDCKETNVTDAAKDKAIAKKLWDMSETAVKLSKDERHY